MKLAVLVVSGPARGPGWSYALERLVGAGADRVEVLPTGSVNAFARDCACERLWIHDLDLLLPFAEVVCAAQQRPHALALKPFSHYTALDLAGTEAVLAGAAWPSQGRELGTAFGKASYLIDRELFLALGGWREGFCDVSQAGFELARRLRTFFPAPEVLEKIRGVSLYRPRAPQEREQILREQDLRRSAGPLADSVCLQRILRREAWRPTVLPHTPRFPTRLPGSLWALTTYFNPQSYLSKRKNYMLFRQALARAGVPLCCVELAFDERPFELAPEDADLLVQRRGGDILWQKERLLNLGVGSLPPDCDKVAWLDCDILLDRPDWADQTRRLLEQYVVVQPFSRCVRLLPEETCCPIEDLPLGSCEHEILHSLAWGVGAHGTACLGNYHRHGHSGYAWAARRDVLERHGLYEGNILGNADLNIAQAMYGGCRFLRSERLSPAARRHLMKWAESFYSSVRASVSAAEGLLFHLWHGCKADRLYDQRLNILIDHDYDPASDIGVGENGTLRWRTDKPGLHAWCRDYFALRREDS